LPTRCSKLARSSKTAGIRLRFIPDQFVVLSSDRPEVPKTASNSLANHARIMDLLGLAAAIVLGIDEHSRRQGGDPFRLISVIRDFSSTRIRSRLTSGK
jgi:UV DNA damage endonuclease